MEYSIDVNKRDLWSQYFAVPLAMICLLISLMTCLLVTHMKSQITTIANHNYPVNSTNSSHSLHTQAVSLGIYATYSVILICLHWMRTERSFLNWTTHCMRTEQSWTMTLVFLQSGPIDKMTKLTKLTTKMSHHW